ncbi:flagellar basal body P-ring formation chaperone FlgA [Campylobacterota bacterium]
MKHIFFLLLMNTFSFSAILESKYTLLTPELNASVIYPDIQKDFSIYTFDENKNRKSFSSKTLIKIFESHNLSLSDNSKGIVHFERTSDIDMGPVEKEIEAYYLSHYPNMKIDSIQLDPNGTITELPKEYTLMFKPHAHRYNHSSLQLTSNESNERYFLSYTILATIKVFKASHNINRGKILTYIDLKHTNEPFTRLTGIPLQRISKSPVRLKKRLQKGKIIYEHDVEALPYVLKNKPVYVRLTNGNVHLEFQAKSLQDGKVGDMISIQKKDNTRLKAKVVGKNLVEIE